MAKATFGIPGMRISGELWGAVLVTMPDGTTVLRQKPTRRPVRTEAQERASARLKPVGEAWRGLAPEAHAAWVYAAGGTGRAAYLMFTALASKCLQMRPGAPVPLLPPTVPFAGDGIRVTVDSLPLGKGRDGIERSEEEGRAREDETGPLPLPPLQDEPLGEGVLFTANAPNAPGVVTELMAVRVPNANRRPQTKAYRTRGFVAFAAAGEEAVVPCGPGTALVAVRFVEAATGQASGLVPLGRVVVG